MSVNKVILLGYVGNDPDIRYPEKDRAVAFLSLATNEYYANSSTEITEWHRLVWEDKTLFWLKNISARVHNYMWRAGLKAANMKTNSRSGAESQK